MKIITKTIYFKTQITINNSTLTTIIAKLMIILSMLMIIMVLLIWIRKTVEQITTITERKYVE